MRAAAAEDCTSVGFCRAGGAGVLSGRLQRAWSDCGCLSFCVLHVRVWERFFSTLTLVAPTFNGGSPMDRAVTIGSSACSSSYSPPVQSPLDIISSKIEVDWMNIWCVAGLLSVPSCGSCRFHHHAHQS